MFDGFEERLYYEVLLPHQKKSRVEGQACICGWIQDHVMADTFNMHLASKVNNWIEANFMLYDKI
jgi:hypothetical protein